MKQLSFLETTEFTKDRKGFNEQLKVNPPKTQEELRKMEMSYLEPTPLPDPTKARTFTKGNKKLNIESYLHKILLYFHNTDDYELFKKHVKVNTYIEENAYDLALIMKLLQAYDDGRIGEEVLNGKT